MEAYEPETEEILAVRALPQGGDDVETTWIMDDFSILIAKLENEGKDTARKISKLKELKDG